MYGTIPIAASFSRNGMREDFLAVFMMTSILLNPQLIIYSSSLGITVLLVRIISALVCGIVFGLLINAFFKNKSFFNFSGFQSPRNNDTDANILKRFLYNLGRNIKKTAPYFLVGVLLSALFQRYIPAEYFASLFGKTNEGFGLLLASTIGVPLYACGGGTIPLLKEWLVMGMSVGSAAAFMITGPATKITNLGALKIVLGVKNFILYIIFIITFSIMTGFIVNLII